MEHSKYTAKSSAKRNAIAQLKKAGKSERADGISITKDSEGKYFWYNQEAMLNPKGIKEDGLLHVSAMVGACALVWEVAEQMLKADPEVKRKAILAECTAKGVAYYTARTQYQLYRKAIAKQDSAQVATI